MRRRLLEAAERLRVWALSVDAGLDERDRPIWLWVCRESGMAPSQVPGGGTSTYSAAAALVAESLAYEGEPAKWPVQGYIGRTEVGLVALPLLRLLPGNRHVEGRS